MAMSLGDAFGISEVRLPGQSEVAFNFVVRRLCQNVSAYRPDCLFQTVTGFLGGHPSKSRYSKDLQDRPQIMGLGNGPKQD